MAAVTLSGIYLAPVADLSDQLHLNAGVTLAETNDARTQARRYSAGRVRMVKQVGRDKQVTLTARRIDRTTREQLDDWAGVLLLLRDGRGRRVFGFYNAPSFTEQPGLPVCDVSLALVQVSYDESV